MIGMNVFTSNAFEVIELSGVVNNMDYNPQMLGGMGIFSPKPVRQKNVFVDQKDDTLSLIGFSERGSAPDQNTRYERKSINFNIPRIAIQDTVHASEVSGLRGFGTENDVETVMREVSGRLEVMRQKVEYTQEYLRLAAVQAKVLDPRDGSVFYDYFNEFGITPEADVSFELDVDTTDVKKICRDLVRSVQRSAKGAWIMGQSTLVGLVGDDFFDALINHPDVKETWLNWQASQELRNIDPFSEFPFGGIRFINYRGSDDNSEVAIPVDEAKFFISGGEGIFVKAIAPADEFAPFVNTPGRDVYAIQELDSQFAATPRFSKYHVHSYPLYMCQKPNTLRSGTLT